MSSRVLLDHVHDVVRSEALLELPLGHHEAHDAARDKQESPQLDSDRVLLVLVWSTGPQQHVVWTGHSQELNWSWSSPVVLFFQSRTYNHISTELVNNIIKNRIC